MYRLILTLIALLGASSLLSQNTLIRGRVIDFDSEEPIPDVEVNLESTSFHVLTDALGEFWIFGADLPAGEQLLRFQKLGYRSQRMPVLITAQRDHVFPDVYLQTDPAEVETLIGVISLSEEQLDEDEGTSYSVSGLLQASGDVFHRAAAFDFSSTFFRPRGYDAADGKILINGLEMNKFYDGRPQWSNWGGLNDSQRNQVFTPGLEANEYAFGDLAGLTNISMQASRYREGGRISYAAANRSYIGRIMASYNSGLLPSKWAYSVLLSRRFAKEGYREGTVYDANSIFIAVERLLGSGHSLNLMGIYTPNRRGKSSPNSDEVYQLKGTAYNSYWGKQDGKIRNSRIKEVAEPVFMVNHYWDWSEKTQWNTNLGYQFGKIGNSRLGYDNVPNPDPSYYKKLPGYFLAEPGGPNYSSAYKAYSKFVEDGQIDWVNLYENNLLYGGTSRYYLYSDRNDDSQLMASSILNSRPSDRITLTAAVNYRKLKSRNFAFMEDLLGGNGYLDIDVFNQGDASQNDLNNPDRIVEKGQRFKYNYDLNAVDYSGFVQTEFSFHSFNFYLAGKLGKSSYQREGHYRNGSYPDGNDSYGKSKKLNFSSYGVKGGFTYFISGRHALKVNGAYFTKPPALRNSFSNARQNNAEVIRLKEEQVINLDGSYIFRSPFLTFRISGYYTLMQRSTNISFYYADGISIEEQTATTAFIQEVLTGINRENSGLEMGMEARVSSTVRLKAAAAYGQFIYKNNPELYVTSDDFVKPQFFGKSFLKNYKIAGGPQQAYQLGFEYNDPDYWWVGITSNFFSNAYISVAPLARTRNFYTDSDGFPIIDYDPALAAELLKQEKFDSYFLLNAVGGKSWRVKQYFVGFFISINNILDKEYKTGGFEQGRNANYKTLKKDVAGQQRVFGPKYWYGYGTSYYINFYCRF